MSKKKPTKSDPSRFITEERGELTFTPPKKNKKTSKSAK